MGYKIVRLPVIGNQEKKKKKLGLITIFLLIISSSFLVILFSQYLLKLASAEFIEKYLLISSLTLFSLGFSALQIDEKDKKGLKEDLLNASIFTFVSVLFSILYLTYPNPIILDINFASLSIWVFIVGFMYFFFILIIERRKLI